ncbi:MULTISPECIES: glycosyltransferase [unclassified Pseudomonas]|uniref:glycosyltransferase n=1 Tax=unclassified Pseudomonas TaxID=196821 RepID=UPI0002A30071|nr:MULTISPECIES: glycosyltransferase [unclassified Pseudomonas]MBB1606423.1 GlcNAc transferase [Pseudomonas sp. UMC76]MBB1640803.1 GlcNAc transferase [Pseudomonas sp. UME83]NTX91109.1 glycosyltransferase family 4 protein [Pseudomonas sp. UMA643]NTY18581.1 glycosyltransferase family 4 protein [Pseudomonas sp. UMC3103]NTY23605.1 glycosyltransferase family 4 protein [Pseudomonas sp. UMA603]
MKILLISNMYPSDKNPGYGAFVKNFKNSIESFGVEFETSVIYGRATSKTDKIRKYIIFFTKTLKKLLFEKYDAIYVHYIAHSLLPLLPLVNFKKIKLVCNAHGEDLLPRSFVERLIFQLVKSTIAKSRLIVVPSDFFQRIAQDKFPNNNIIVSPSAGVDLSIFKPHAINRDNHSLKLGYVSRIDPGKGWDTLLNAVSLIRKEKPDLKLELKLAGDGSQVSELSDCIKSLDLEEIVSYVGPIPQANLPVFYSALDLFIFPTILQESLGLVGIEALACGTPAICSATGGITSYIRDGENGYLFQPGHHRELAEKIISFSNLTSEVRKSLRAEAISTAEKFDQSLVAADLYQKITDAIQ